MATSSSKKSQDLAARLLGNFYFAISWIACLSLVMNLVSWPIRNVLLVFWVYGKKGYYQDGIRVVSSKPTVFSTGVHAPELPNIVTGFGAFLVTAFGLTLLLIFALRFYERHFMKGEHAA